LTTKSTAADAEWSDADAGIVGKVLDTVVGIDAEIELQTLH
jgi:hypothetical protein